MIASTNRAAIVRTEEASASWLSSDGYNDLSLDAGLLLLCVIAFVITRFGLASKGKNQGRDPETAKKRANRPGKSRSLVHQVQSSATLNDCCPCFYSPMISSESTCSRYIANFGPKPIGKQSQVMMPSTSFAMFPQQRQGWAEVKCLRVCFPTWMSSESHGLQSCTYHC